MIAAKYPGLLTSFQSLRFRKKMVNEISSVDHYEEIKRDKSKRLIEFYFISRYEKTVVERVLASYEPFLSLANKFFNTIILFT